MTRATQRGVSILGWLLILILIGSIATLAVKLAPHYVDYVTIVRLVEALPPTQVHTMDKTEIRDSLKKRFLINNIRDMDVQDVVHVERKRETTNIIIEYERREHIAYNVDVVLTFDRTFEFH
jgi:hypothetical protein